MRETCGSVSGHGRAGERGGTRLSFLIVMVVVIALAYAGFKVVPSLYYGSTFETFMQDTVNAAALTDKTPAWVEQQLRGAFPDYDIPPEAAVRAVINDGRMEAHVQYKRAIPLVVTQYDYTFDETVRSATAAMVAR